MFEVNPFHYILYRWQFVSLLFYSQLVYCTEFTYWGTPKYNFNEILSL